MKPALFAFLGVLLGIGGGSAMSVMKAKKGFATYDAKRAKLVADSIELAANTSVSADSSHALPGDSTEVPGADSAHVGATTPPPTVAATGPHGVPAPAHEAVPKPATDHAAPPTTRAVAPPEEPINRQRALATVESHGGTKPSGRPALPPKPIDAPAVPSGTARLGKIFAAMPPKDAARVLEQLNDTEAHEIVRGLNDKQAAGIMQFLPAARAAAISKLALKGGNK